MWLFSIYFFACFLLADDYSFLAKNVGLKRFHTIFLILL